MLSIIFLASVYRVHINPPVTETDIKVFMVYKHEKRDRTYVLTYGKGKYVFLGDYTDVFELDKTYHIVAEQADDITRYRLLEVYEIG